MYHDTIRCTELRGCRDPELCNILQCLHNDCFTPTLCKGGRPSHLRPVSIQYLAHFTRRLRLGLRLYISTISPNLGQAAYSPLISSEGHRAMRRNVDIMHRVMMESRSFATTATGRCYRRNYGHCYDTVQAINPLAAPEGGWGSKIHDDYNSPPTRRSSQAIDEGMRPNCNVRSLPTYAHHGDAHTTALSSYMFVIAPPFSMLWPSFIKHVCVDISVKGTRAWLKVKGRVHRKSLVVWGMSRQIKGICVWRGVRGVNSAVSCEIWLSMGPKTVNSTSAAQAAGAAVATPTNNPSTFAVTCCVIPCMGICQGRKDHLPSDSSHLSLRRHSCTSQGLWRDIGGKLNEISFGLRQPTSCCEKHNYWPLTSRNLRISSLSMKQHRWPGTSPLHNVSVKTYLWRHCAMYFSTPLGVYYRIERLSAPCRVCYVVVEILINAQ